MLLGGQERLHDLLVAAVHDAPGQLAPLDVPLGAFRSIGHVMEDGGSWAQPRNEVIVATPALREREVAKLATPTGALASALVERGTAPQRATPAAHAATTAFTAAARARYDDPAEKLGTWLADAFDDLRAVCAP